MPMPDDSPRGLRSAAPRRASGAAPMSLTDAVSVLHRVRRRDEVIITSMGNAREWMRLPPDPLDFVFVPSAMGHPTSLGLGLALARPRLRVVACIGDGSLLMNLGTLVTISAAAPANLTVVIFDNGVYEITGAQPTPGAAAGRDGAERVDYEGIARASGIERVNRPATLDEWERESRALLDQPGPSVIILDVAPVPGAKGPRSPGPTAERGPAFMRALQERDGHGDRSSS